MDPNPYDAPHAPLEHRTPSDYPELLAEPRQVAAGRGVEWFAEGWQLVMLAPGAWIGAFLLLVLGMVVLSCVPLGSNLFMPVLIAGLALGCEAQRRGEAFNIEYLWAGFRSPQLGQLVLVGLLTIVATLIVIVAIFPFLFGAIALVETTVGPNDPAAAFVIVPVFVLLIALAVVPLTMATVFAPMLVVFHGMPAMDAMKLSLRGSLRNVGAVLVAMVMYVLITLVAILPCLLGLMLAIPVAIAANYFAYRDIFCVP
jgi:hypothetical protein